ncbi:sulfatase-like hydrolase/transferase [Achromobacter marplatensis]|uniref:sulfatase-like hydrolase/transferase n=1 Tax=Achromobacter marplatensis TaxID=470868 RepID=UPI0039F6C9CD
MSGHAVRNVLWIMCDQLRWDYLSCYGHPRLHTPNIDRLAAEGMRFTNAFVQGPVCGPSRMSYYTGRYVTSHGAVWNFVPMPVSELTLGDHLRPHGVRVAVAGKTHVEADIAGLRRLGVDLDSPAARLAMQGGFEPFDRDDGIWPPGFADDSHHYTRYLRQRGYDGPNPWHDHANSALGAAGEILSGWRMRSAGLPARVREEDSETPYMTRRAIEFMEENRTSPWVLHLSYIKPHWPYVAPAPYHAIYTRDDVMPVKQDPRELQHAHPVLRGFREAEVSQNFSRQQVRDTVIPTYMGLIKQVDDQLGVLFDYLRDSGRDQDTMVVFCSDHGDYLGDHYLGEKELFHDCVAKVPLIIRLPGADRNARRGAVEPRLVEAIDLVPTILEAYGVEVPDHVVEGRSLMPLLHGKTPVEWRNAVFSENDYAFRDFVREPLGRPADGCHSIMVRDHDWKYVHFDGLAPQLFDLRDDPDEFVDLGTEPAYAPIRERYQAALFDWLRKRKIHPTISHRAMTQWTRKEEKVGIHIGRW